METEHWQYIPGYEKLYAVSTLGRVIAMRGGFIKKARVIRRNKYVSEQYLVVEFNACGVRKKIYVHTLVLLAFRGPHPPDGQCRHLNGNPLDNRLINLEWGTYRQNLADRRRDMRRMILNPDKVRYIRSSIKTSRALAAELGCSKTQVCNVKAGRFWADIL